jgi:hypothetical protein
MGKAQYSTIPTHRNEGVQCELGRRDLCKVWVKHSTVQYLPIGMKESGVNSAEEISAKYG